MDPHFLEAQMTANQTSIEASAIRVGGTGDDLTAQARKSQHVSDSISNDIKHLSPEERTAIFDKMSAASTIKPSNLPDLKLTESAAGVRKDEGKADTVHDARQDVKQDGKQHAKHDGKHDTKHDAKHDADDSNSKHAGAKHGHLKNGKHSESHTNKGLGKEIPGSTNYTLREQDEAHPGQIVEKTYDKSGKLIPDAPVKVIETSTKANGEFVEQKFDKDGKPIPGDIRK
jgi:hypothetical protein